MIKRSGDFYKEAMGKLQQISVTGKNEEETREAIRLLTQALNLVPDDMRLLVLRSKAYRSVGDFETSLKDIDDATFHYCQSMLGSEVSCIIARTKPSEERSDELLVVDSS